MSPKALRKRSNPGDNPYVAFRMYFGYLTGQNSGEIVMCVIFGFFFLISAMIILIIDDKVCENYVSEYMYTVYLDERLQLLWRHRLV